MAMQYVEDEYEAGKAKRRQEAVDDLLTFDHPNNHEAWHVNLVGIITQVYEVEVTLEHIILSIVMRSVMGKDEAVVQAITEMIISSDRAGKIKLFDELRKWKGWMMTKEVAGTSANIVRVNMARGGKGGGGQPRENTGEAVPTCTYCGKRYHTEKDCFKKFPKLLKCTNCGGNGHWSADCTQQAKDASIAVQQATAALAEAERIEEQESINHTSAVHMVQRGQVQTHRPRQMDHYVRELRALTVQTRGYQDLMDYNSHVNLTTVNSGEQQLIELQSRETWSGHSGLAGKREQHKQTNKNCDDQKEGGVKQDNFHSLSKTEHVLTKQLEISTTDQIGSKEAKEEIQVHKTSDLKLQAGLKLLTVMKPQTLIADCLYGGQTRMQRIGPVGHSSGEGGHQAAKDTESKNNMTQDQTTPSSDQGFSLNRTQKRVTEGSEGKQLQLLRKEPMPLKKKERQAPICAHPP